MSRTGRYAFEQEQIGGGALLQRILVVAALAMGLILGTVAPAQAQERPSCAEGSRRIDASGAIEVQTRMTDGSRGRAQITLRRLPAENCFWGLLEGPGEIWLERVSYYDVGAMNPDYSLYRRANKGFGVKHTAATVTTEHRVRACGRATNGSSTTGGSVGAGAGVDGRTPTVGVSIGKNWSDTYEFDNGVVCTIWASTDVIRPRY